MMTIKQLKELLEEKHKFSSYSWPKNQGKNAASVVNVDARTGINIFFADIIKTCLFFYSLV